MSAVRALLVDPEAPRSLRFGEIPEPEPGPGEALVEGAAGPADTAVLGGEAAVERALRTLAEAGATELIASPVGTPEEQRRTKELLAALSSRT